MIYYEQKEKKSLGFIVICLFLIVIIYILVNLINKVDYNMKVVSTPDTTEVTSLRSNDINVENLVENSMYSIVGISKLRENTTSSFSNDLENILGMGSGIVISQDGYILTNSHITGGLYSSCYVNLRNGESYSGKVVWEDKVLDIAILKTNAITLPSMVFANTDDCSLGERVYLLSNYTGYELQKTVEEGIVSKVNDTFSLQNDNELIYVEDVMKIDIEATNQNTGGAVINENGELIGILSSINNSVIPIKRISNVINKLSEEGKCDKIDLGIYGFDNEIIKYLDNKMNIDSGVYIEKVDENSLVKGRVNEGEIITKIDDNEVRKMSDIKEYIYGKNVGDIIVLSVIRNKVEEKIEVSLR